jgi:hypothetical protein
LDRKNIREAPATDTTVTITSLLLLLLFLFVATTQTMRGGGGGSQRFWLTLLLLVLAVVGGNWLLFFCGPYRNSIIESTTVPRTTTVNRRRTTQTTRTSRSDVVPVVSQTTSDYATMADDVVAMLEAQMKYRVFKRKKKSPLPPPQLQNQQQQPQEQPQPQTNRMFLPPATLSQFDMYGAAWWQSIDRFMQDDYRRMWTLEDGTFRPIYAAGNGSLDVRMTIDWLELAVEHWSDYHRLLDANASQHVIAKLADYVSATTTAATTSTTSSSSNTTITAMQSTLAVLPFQACNKDERVELRVNGNFCTTALTATIASLVRQGVGRVVVVTSYDDHSVVQDAIDDLARRFAPTTTIVVIPTNIITVGKWKHMPKTALVGLYEAWRVQNTTWLGSSNNPRDTIKYIYYTEPDQILIGQLSTSAMQYTMDRHHILVPHRLEVMPHEDDFRDIETASVKIPSSSSSTHRDDDDDPNPIVVLDAPGACCDSGRKQRVQRCPGELAWYKCAFPPHNNSFADVFGQRQNGHPQLMRIQQGSGFTVLTMQGIGVENSFCRPQRTAESCQTTTTADQDVDVGRGVAID